MSQTNSDPLLSQKISSREKQIRWRNTRMAWLIKLLSDVWGRWIRARHKGKGQLTAQQFSSSLAGAALFRSPSADILLTTEHLADGLQVTTRVMTFPNLTSKVVVSRPSKDFNIHLLHIHDQIQ